MGKQMLENAVLTSKKGEEADSNADAIAFLVIDVIAALGFGFGTGSFGVCVGVFFGFILLSGTICEGAKIIAKAIKEERKIITP
ncbi:MAG: hypothetical protein Q7R94_00985 [bacterium]|nr:hypothetical protein [bacterium]